MRKELRHGLQRRRTENLWKLLGPLAFLSIGLAF